MSPIDLPTSRQGVLSCQKGHAAREQRPGQHLCGASLCLQTHLPFPLQTWCSHWASIVKEQGGILCKEGHHLYQGTIPNQRHLNATETQSPIWHSVRVTGYIRRSREILRAGVGKNNRMVAIQRDPGCCMGQWQREESWTPWILPVRVPRATLASRLGRFAGERAQADLGSAEIEGKEKKERSISNKFQGLTFAQPVLDFTVTWGFISFSG